MVSTKKAVAFCSSARRFPAKGYHPNLQSVGCLRDYPNIGPGTYNPKEGKTLQNISFTKQKESENFSKTLGYRVPHVLARRQHDRERGLAFHYEIPDFIQIQSSKSKCQRHNVSFGTIPKFYSAKKNINPGPGTYGKDQPPSKPQCLSSTFVPSFEWDGFIKRSLIEYSRYKLPPNIYNVKDKNSIQEYVKKTVSKRGPYDVFTGPRDGSTIKNHFSPPQFKGVKSWPTSLPSPMDGLKHPSKQKYGVWGKEASFDYVPTSRIILNNPSLCPRPADRPGPGHYSTKLPNFKPVKGKTYHFDSSVKYIRPRKREEITPAPGRYNPKNLGKVRSYREVFRAVTRHGKPPEKLYGRK